LKQFLLGCVCLALTSLASAAGDISYVLLYKSGGLARISDDGTRRTTIASGVLGYGLAADNNGDYIVAALHWLVRVTPSGAVTTIAEAPQNSQWLSVAVDSGGNYIVGDNHQHRIGNARKSVESSGPPVNHSTTPSSAWQPPAYSD